jgi:hypothetical protein
MTKAIWIAVASMISLGALAADEIKVCEVIPVGDVESTLGFKSVRTQPGYRECSWFAAANQSFATIKAFVRYRHKIDTAGYVDAMSKAGAKVTVIDDKPDLWCARLVMPSSKTNAMECRVLTKGHYMELLATGPAITPEKAKALLAKMSAKLP